ncbi:TonB-dependent receptor [Sphingomonas sp. KR1UV-12]|uniref:TonB-dependent receptor n=1 Tax=Sphingomonas aurea TaxID=3063994 RepID=A0ABT9EJF2_9SPHN|nr:TonB-dependent receptor [Sphingomonas sp. KR1UV-12]MDP1027064.1 TonB-dependent receptor [Sphingomonas sp. KR1UV-12]
MLKSFTAVLAVSASSLVMASAAIAQSTATPPTIDQTDSTEPTAIDPQSEIVVTGTRASNRTVAQSNVPIDVISSEALTNATGTGDTNKILNQLVPSFNFPQPSIADGSDVIRPATLRGLSPDQTLVLVNGKRRHVSSLLNINGTVGRGSAAVDLNTIPALAIERIEVLRDGASSQYGSDAIAGVINVQLKRGVNTGRAQVSYGKYVTHMAGVPELLGLQTSGGQPFFDPNDAVAAVNGQAAAGSRYLAGNYGGDAKRNDGDTWVLGANIGIPIGPGYLNVTGEYRDRDAVNRAGYDTRPNYLRPSTTTFDARELTFNRLNFQLGDPKTEDYNVFVNAGMPLGNSGFEFYSFGSYAHRDGLSAANYRQASNAANRDYSAVPANVALTNANFVAIYADGFLPLIQSDYDDYSIAAGVKGDLGPWSVDLSGVYGHNEIDYRTLNSINTSFGSAGPRNVDAGGIRFGQFTANLDVTREFDLGFVKPLTFAVGAEYRHENFKERAGQVESYAAGPFASRGAAIGQQGFPGIPAAAATDNSRDSYAGYIEFDTDLFAGLTATAAGRYEHYSDFGDTLNGKLALRYEFAPALAVRGSISNGFRAPSLHQQYFTTTSTNFVAGVPVDIVTAQVSSPIARALGSQPLDPEKSINLSAGITSNPFRGFNLTADYYHIKINDRIVLTENLGSSGNAVTDAAARAALNANGFSSVGAARFFINGLDTTTQGVDVVGTYRLRLGDLGSWSLSAAYNYTQNKIDKRLNNLGPLASNPNIILFGRVEGIRFEKGQPRDKVVLSADGDLGVFGVTARSTRYGRVIAPTATSLTGTTLGLSDYGPDDVFLRPKWITDLEARYTFKEHMTFAIGANNLFDVYPTRLPFGPRAASVGGQNPANQIYIPYSGFSPFGFNGRFIYGRVTAQF